MRLKKKTGAYLGLGILTALPFFIRNVVISGWLVYPFTQIDLFDVVWKIPRGLADYDAREIQVWGRGYTDVAQFDMPVREWLPGWFGTLAGSDKVFVLAAVAAVAVLLAEAAYLIWRKHKEYRASLTDSVARERVMSPALFLAQATVAASFLFWLCTSPLIRYGCVWVYLTAAVVFGGLYEAVMRFADGGWRMASGRTVSALIVLLLIYKGAALARETAGSYVNDYWLVQKDYDNYETRPYEIAGVTFYCPIAGDQVGYSSFPSSPSEAGIGFLGEGISDGFRADK